MVHCEITEHAWHEVADARKYPLAHCVHAYDVVLHVAQFGTAVAHAVHVLDVCSVKPDAHAVHTLLAEHVAQFDIGVEHAVHVVDDAR